MMKIGGSQNQIFDRKLIDSYNDLQEKSMNSSVFRQIL